MNPASGLWTSQAATRVRKRRPQTSGRRATRSPLRCRRPRRPPRPPRRHDRTGSCVSLGPFGLGAAISWLAFLVVPPAVSRPPSGRRRARRYDFLLLLSLQLTTSSSTQKPKAHCRGVARHTKWSRALQGHTHDCIPAPPDTSFCGTVMMHIKSEFATAPQSFR